MPPKKTSAAVKITNSAPAEITEQNISVKKNERPPDEKTSVETADEPQKLNRSEKNNSRPEQSKTDFKPDFVYEFTQPNFVISRLTIKHDENGKGEISFVKSNFDEPINDPIRLSADTLKKLKNDFQAVDYFAGNVNYQYDKDFSHLGNISLQVVKNGQTRSTKFNYTTDKNAKNLADDYRRIGQQFVWIFDIKVARENQPLETPGLIDLLESYIGRNEIADPVQMLPFLNELSNDERLPLIARNHAAKIAQKIGKKNK